MDTNLLISNIGYCEMYEWVKQPSQNDRFGKFVQFSEEHPGKIEPYHNASAIVVGVSTVEAKVLSDDADFWHGQFMYNEFGDAYLGKDKYIAGKRKYDHLNEFSFIATEIKDELLPISSEKFDKTKDFIKRSNRLEWAKVNLLGKVIVIDNGTLKPGDMCMPYSGSDASKFGTAVKATTKAKYKYYVVDRVSENTVTILNK